MALPAIPAKAKKANTARRVVVVISLRELSGVRRDRGPSASLPFLPFRGKVLPRAFLGRPRTGMDGASILTPGFEPPSRLHPNARRHPDWQLGICNQIQQRDCSGISPDSMLPSTTGGIDQSIRTSKPLSASLSSRQRPSCPPSPPPRKSESAESQKRWKIGCDVLTLALSFRIRFNRGTNAALDHSQ